METEAKNKKGIWEKLGSVSQNTVSLLATIAISIAFIFPAVVAILAMLIKTTDFSLAWHMLYTQSYVLPAVCVISFAIYILVFARAKLENANLKEIIRKNPLLILFSLLVLLMFISQAYNGLDYAFGEYFIMQLGETFDMELSYFIFVLFCGTQVKIEKHKAFLLRVHLLVSMLLVLAGFVLWKNVFDFELVHIRPDGFVSIFGNMNYYGYYLAISVPLAGSAFLYEKKISWKIVAMIAFIANTVALSLNDTMGSWIGAGFAVIFIAIVHYIVEKKINWKAILLIPVFIICLLVPGLFTGVFKDNFSNLFSDIGKIVSGDENAGDAGTKRWDEWKASIKVINENKLFGVGFEGAAYRDDVFIYNYRPHNEFIEYTLFYGIPVGILYIAGCLGVFIRALKRKEIMDGATLACLTAAFGYLVSSFFGLTVFSTAMFLFIFLGMGYVREKNEEKHNEISNTNDVL